jgi:hypothetical protein
MTTETLPPDAVPQDLATLAEEAFIYGFPLVFNLHEIGRFPHEGFGPLRATPYNEFGHAVALAGPDTTFVSVNNDTVYSLACIDASSGPVQLDVPDSGGRYYVMQFVDAWTNNFAYVGRRATGTAAASYLLVPPGWSGEAPDGLTVIRLPTAVAAIVGRWAVDGEADLPEVRELQRRLRLTATGAAAGVPEVDARVSEDLHFFETLRTGIQAYPPAARDVVYQQRFASLGLLSEDSPYRDPEPALAAALRAGLQSGRERLEQSLLRAPAPKQNGWDRAYHAFDYNLDFFEVGALDSERWKIPEGPLRYLLRAGSARAGLWGNQGYEAAYAMVYVDADGEPLHGDHRYELRFDTPPPSRAFWSVTMYDATDFFLVDNPIDRYSIGDRTPDLRRGVDGSLTITLQHAEPTEPAARANWLPAPAGAFRPLIRMYEPDEALFDGSWELPPIRRVS